MRNLDNNCFSPLSYEELVNISGGTDPGDFMRDCGVIVGKIGGWIVNAFTADTKDHWMMDVDPKLLFG
jgi:hypothetical protein